MVDVAARLAQSEKFAHVALESDIRGDHRPRDHRGPRWRGGTHAINVSMAGEADLVRGGDRYPLRPLGWRGAHLDPVGSQARRGVLRGLRPLPDHDPDDSGHQGTTYRRAGLARIRTPADAGTVVAPRFEPDPGRDLVRVAPAAAPSGRQRRPATSHPVLRRRIGDVGHRHVALVGNDQRVHRHRVPRRDQ